MSSVLLMTLVLSQDFIAAVTEGNAAKVQEMLAAQPELATAKDKNGLSALLTAVFRQKTAVIQAILSAGAPLDMPEAAAVGHTDRVRELARKDKASVNAYDVAGFFPLGLAVFFGHRETAEALIALGADVNQRSRESMKVSPLHSAMAAGRLDVAKILLKHGANPNAASEGDFRPLHEAAARGRFDIVRVLLDAGADINARSADGKTPLAFAAERKQDAMVAFLKSKGGV